MPQSTLATRPTSALVTRTARFMTATLIIGMPILVPYGRPLQNAILARVPAGGFSVVLGACALIALALLRAAWIRLPRSIFAVWVLSLCCIAALTCRSLVEPVEAAHPLLFSMLTAAAALSVRPPHFAYGISIAATMAIGDECLQLLAPSRVFDPRDIALNFTGVLSGLIAIWPFLRRRLPFRQKFTGVGTCHHSRSRTSVTTFNIGV